MKELILKAETDEDLFKMAKAYVDGYLINTPPKTYSQLFSELNPKGKTIVSKKQTKTSLTKGKSYLILSSYGQNQTIEGYVHNYGRIRILNDSGIEKTFNSGIFSNIEYPTKLNN